MNWKKLSPVKKGFLIGVLTGLLFGIYSNITTCHTGLIDGPIGCNNSLELYIAFFEFILWAVPVLLLSWLPDFLDTVVYRLSFFISPIILFGLVGLFLGKVSGKIISKN